MALTDAQVLFEVRRKVDTFMADDDAVVAAYAELPTVPATQLYLLETFRAGIMSGAIIWNNAGDSSENWTRNLEALDRDIAAVRATIAAAEVAAGGVAAAAGVVAAVPLARTDRGRLRAEGTARYYPDVSRS